MAVLIALSACPACRRREPTPPDATGRVEGRVTDLANHPLADVTVEIGADPPDGRVPIAHARTTSAGIFAVDRIPAGRYALSTRHATHAPATVSIAVPAGGTARAELRLPPFAALEGHIEDTHGTPVPLAHVVAVGASPTGAGAGANAPIFHESRADSRGRFELGESGAWHLPSPDRGSRAGYGLGRAADRARSRGGHRFARREPLDHRHRHPRGHPVPGARVHLGGETLSETRTTETDLTGRFAFPGIGPGSYATRAELGPLVSAVVSDIAVGFGVGAPAGRADTRSIGHLPRPGRG